MTRHGAQGYVRVREGWVQWMQRRTNKVTPRGWKVGLTSLVVCMGMYCTWIVIDGFQPRTPLRIESIRRPRYVTAPRPEDQRPVSLSAAERKRLEAFVQYMDSLSRAPLHQTYDSIHHARPGLLDSVRQLLHYE